MTTSSPVPAVAGPAPAPPRASRLAWLDALRGLAALCVVYTHFGSRVFLGFHSAVLDVFDPGLYGVLVFFLISGYIVPASLERRGSVRTFWVGRVFRLFPLFAIVIGGTAAMAAAGVLSLPGHDLTAAALSHLFMLNDFLGEDNLLVVIWTLSYEMVFYLLLTALFTARLHKRSGGMAGIFAAAALVLGGVLPTSWISYHSIGLAPVAMISDGLVLGGLALAVATRGVSRTAGAWLAAATGLILLVFNERRFGYEGLTILALMFTGTLLYRAQHGRPQDRRRAVLIAAGVFAAVIAAGAWHIPALSTSVLPQQREWVVSVALAGLTFAAGLVMQDRRVPRPLAWLGLVSYSVYLTHPLLLALYDATPFAPGGQHPAWQQAVASVLFAAALLGSAALTYYFVEVPMQRLGRRATSWLDARFGPERQHAAAHRAPAPLPAALARQLRLS